MERCSRFLIGLLLMISLFSCNLSSIQEFQLGQDFVDSNAGVVLIDTMYVNTSTVRFDSIVTSKTSRLLIGGYKNGFTGSVTCIPHFEISNGSFMIPGGTLVFDSLSMRMSYDGYFVGDTSKLFTFNVREIAEKLKLNDNGYLYNTSSFQLYDQSLGQARFYPQPHSKKDFYVRLSDNFGKELFNNIINKNDTMQTYSYFKEYFKGMALSVSENQNSSAVGFVPDSTDVRVYFHKEVNEVDTKVKTFFSFPIDASGVWYNQIAHSTTGSFLEAIGQNKNELQSTQTSNNIMMQAGNGIYAKIKIPGIDYVKGFGKNVVFISARIQITPLKDSYSDVNPLPDSLSVYIADHKNRITSQLSSTSGYLYASKVVPVGFDKLPYYEVDLTPFFTSEIANVSTTDNSLLIGSVASVVGKTINPFVFAGAGVANEIVKLHVYCYIDKNN